MSGKSNPSGGGSSGSSSNYTPYTTTSTGTNSQVPPPSPPLSTSLPDHFQGNSYDTRSQPSGSAYHYSNTVSYALSPLFLHF